jgi:predicted transcriptional regulator YheO
MTFYQIPEAVVNVIAQTDGHERRQRRRYENRNISHKQKKALTIFIRAQTSTPGGRPLSWF